MDLFLREATERIGPQGYDSLDLFKSVLDWPMARSEQFKVETCAQRLMPAETQRIRTNDHVHKNPKTQPAPQTSSLWILI